MSTLLTVKRVKSLTIGFMLPETYDMSRVEEIKIYLGKNVYPHTIDERVVKCQIKSDDTAVMCRVNRLSFWLDDSIIGVYPIYCGDIVFEYTNAIEHNESINKGFDLMVNLTISETAITVDNVLYNYVKGDKGDTFLYSDFTPAQIAELQQPANDAIASIQAVEVAISGNENNRVDAEHDRNQEEINRQEQEVARQTNTSTAILNAQTATTSANNAATLANTKAGLADTAATNANTKAGLADTAATNADNARLAIQGDLALKENTANKQNSLATDGTGTKFPTVDAVNGGLNSTMKLLADYTHNTNIVLPQIQSIDYATSTFTFTAPHGISVVPFFYSQNVCAYINDYRIKQNYKSIPSGLYQRVDFNIVEIISPTAFRCSNSPAGTNFVLPNVDSGFVDFTKFHLEICKGNYEILFENSVAVKAVVFARTQHGQPYFGVSGNQTALENAPEIGTILGLGTAMIERTWFISGNGLVTSRTTGTGNTIRSAGLEKVTYDTINTWRYENITYFNKVTFDQFYPCFGNGTRFLIYKLA